MQVESSPMETATKEKPRKRGCLITAIVVAVLVILVAVIAGFFIYRFTQTEEGQKVIGLTRAVAEGSKAPGTAELRDIGCDQAMVLEKGKFVELGLIPDGDMPAGENASGILVVCGAASADPSPSCDTVARTYARSFGGSAPHPFAATVVKEFGGDAECFHYYSGDGTPE